MSYSNFLLSGALWRNCLPKGCRGQAEVVWPCFGTNIHRIANCSWSAQWYHAQKRFHLCLVGQRCAQVSLICAHQTWLYTLAKQATIQGSKVIVASLPASSVLPECWRGRRALCCSFGERSLREGQGKVPPSTVRIATWLRKAGESAPDRRLPVSAARSLHTVQQCIASAPWTGDMVKSTG